jgi:hypothetical protein
MDYAQIDEWLFEECYHSVGDLAETIAHVLPPPKGSSDFGPFALDGRAHRALRGADPAVIRAALFAAWDELTGRGASCSPSSSAAASGWACRACWSRAPWPPWRSWIPSWWRSAW